MTTDPSGEVAPSASFSTELQQTLQDQARTKAETDARAQADQSAKNLGFVIDSVKSVTDGSLDAGGPLPYNRALSSGVASIAPQQLDVQPGQNDLSYSVSVVYYIH